MAYNLTYEEVELALDYFLDSINEPRRYVILPLLDFEKDLLVKEIMRRRKNVASKGSELDQGSSDGEPGKADVIHEVQD